MPTELTEHEVVDALRAVRPDVETPDGWEAEQRRRLLTFIETGVIRAERAASTPTEAPVVPLDRVPGGERRRRAAVVLGVAAAMALLVAGLVIAPRWRGQEMPPATEPRPTPPVTTASMVAPPPELPDLYPVVDGSGDVNAFYLPHAEDQVRRTTALLGRVGADGTLTDGIFVEATDVDQCAESACKVLDLITIDGFDATVYELTRAFDYRVRALAIPAAGGSAVVTLTGADPVGFVEAAGGNPVRVLPNRSNGELDVEIGEIPAGYSVVIAPQPFVRRASSAGVWYSDGASQIAVIAHRDSELLGLGRLGPIEHVDINGTAGWTYDEGVGSPVIWQASPTTWISVTGAPDQSSAIEIARSVRLVDRATWESVNHITVDDDTAPIELPAIPVEGSSRSR